MSTMEGFGGKKTKNLKETAVKAVRVLTLAGSLASGGGVAEAQAQSGSRFDSTTITVAGLALHRTASHKEYQALKRSNVTARINLNVALLAHSADPDYASFSDDKDLALADMINQSLVLPLVKHRSVGPKYWTALQDEMYSSYINLYHNENLATEDVRLDILKDISANNQGIDPIELEESIAYVARNLSIIGKSPTDANVKAEVEKILERRAEIGAVAHFQRNVLLVSGDEILQKFTKHEGEVRFGKQPLRDAIHEQQKLIPSRLTITSWDPFVSDSAPFQSSPEKIAEAKSESLKVIETSTDPLTVVLDGHGNPSAFGLSGHINPSTREIEATSDEMITVDEFADALALRYKAEQKENHTSLQISFISSACYMQNFARNLAEILRARNIPLPDYMISSSEYGQPGFSDWDNKYGSRFNELIATSHNLKAVMDRKHDVKVSDPSILVPRKDHTNQFMQISGIATASFDAIG